MSESAINRKDIFDEVRRMIGRGFTGSEVSRLDSAIDAAVAGAAPAADAGGDTPMLGALSARFESGGRGPGAVSGGQGDPGGVSYGIYQLASRTGTAGRFMQAEGSAWARDFGDAAPGSAAFSRAWRAVASRDGAAFAEAQHAFIERTHYRPAVRSVRRQTTLNLDSRHQAVRDATWSVAVQHGGAARILITAVGQADAAAQRGDAAYDSGLIRAIYAARTAYVLRVADRCKGAAAATLQSITRNRYPAELAAALKMLGDKAQA